MKADVIHEAGNTLGEGPVWYEGAFWCVDIERGLLRRFGDQAKDWEAQGRLGAAVPAADGRFVLCEEDGLAALDTESGERTELTRHLADRADLRHNDAKADPAGRLWLGTMSFEREPAGSLGRFEPPATVVPVLDGVTVGNGLAWRGDAFYYIDTATTRIDQFDYDPATGGIKNRRPLWEVSDVEKQGKPDGMTIDADGNLWVAFFRGRCVRCITPAGKVEAEIECPASHVTSCCFGGPNLRTLYITSGAKDDEPAAGHVFACEPGVAGLPVDVVKLA